MRMDHTGPENWLHSQSYSQNRHMNSLKINEHVFGQFSKLDT